MSLVIIRGKPCVVRGVWDVKGTRYIDVDAAEWQDRGRCATCKRMFKETAAQRELCAACVECDE